MREEFKKLVIMALYPECKSYDEALKKEKYKIGCVWNDAEGDAFIYKGDSTVVEQSAYKLPMSVIGLPITIVRVMKALQNAGFEGYYSFTKNEIRVVNKKGVKTFLTKIIYWQLTKDGKELTDDDQSDETIKALTELLK